MTASCYDLWLNSIGTIKLKSLAFAIEIKSAFCFIRKSKFFFAVKTAPQGRINTDVSATARCGIFPFHKPSCSGTGHPAVFLCIKKAGLPQSC